jgi:hypothetical protein
MALSARLLAAAVVRAVSALRLAGVVLLMMPMVLTGCATTEQAIALKTNESLAIVVTQAPGWPGAIKVRNESVGGESPEGLVGAGAGALAGGAWGLACGPLAGLCVPLGALLGADVGILAGLAVGTTAALPADKIDRLQDRMTRVLQSHDLRSELEAEVVDRAKSHWNVSSDEPAVTVEVELRDVVLSSTRDERIRCVVKAAVTVRGGGANQTRQDRPRAYEYVSPYGSLAAWLDEGDGLVDANLASASRHLATQIVSGIAAKP